MRVLEFWGPGPDLARYLELPITVEHEPGIAP